MRRRDALLALAFGSLLALAAAGPAAADTTTSSNWAGYAAHGRGARFAKVVGMWTQPRATCVPGHRTYSAVWVGLGGFSPRSNALEQVGTELDCSASGRTSSSAWVELVPAASRTVSMRVAPGDTIAAGVTVRGHRASLALYDVTDGQSFKRTLHARVVDVSSAEWIVEAPSDCVSAGSCQTLPLADFGTTSFNLAEATSTAGHVGGVRDRRWSTTKIVLSPGAGRLAAGGRPGPGFVPGTLGAATPSGLTAANTTFSVAYAA